MKKKVNIFGLNVNGLILAEEYLNQGYEVDVFDNSPDKQGRKLIRGLVCKKPDSISEDEVYVIAASQKEHIDAIFNQLKEYGCKNIIVPEVSHINSLKEKMGDEEYLRYYWLASMNYELDLDNPKSLCEKLQWLKLYFRKPEYSKLVDKYEVKKYLSELIGAQYIIPLLGVWDRVEDIRLDELPDQFVLKCTHNSGAYVVCKDKNSFDFGRAKQILSDGISENYYYFAREYPYINVKPRIIAEKYVESLGNPDSVEYKVTCFNGKADFITFCKGPAHQTLDVRFNDHYDMNFEKKNWYAEYKPSGNDYEKPKQWDEMVRISELISKDIPYLRVDFYIINDQLYFGEVTFYTWAGFMRFHPVEWDYILGEKVILPEKQVV